SSYEPIPAEYFRDFNGQVQPYLDRLTVPEPEEFAVGGTYWEEADIRIALDLRGGNALARPVVLRPDLVSGQPSIDEGLTAELSQCLAEDANRVYDEGSGSDRLRPYLDLYGDEVVRAVEYSASFRNNREAGVQQKMLEVDVRGLLECLEDERFEFFADRDSRFQTIGSDRNGGLVWYLTVLGPDADDASSGYGVRVRNGADLSAPSPGSPEIHGLTVVSDQAAFIQGDYNLNPGWRPAAFIADTVNILSSAWDDDVDSTLGLDQRIPSPTTVNAAFLAGTETTGGADGEEGRSGAYSGGLENYPRFHERWSGTVFTYRGSFVSLGEPQHANGPWRIGN
ncbi:MAG: hypothetical protein R3324_21775, partial [Halobacteriales archaeon]|nr:hypothetical protein [Halobacteriales archaeon]